MNIIKNRYFYFLLSLLIIIPGIVYLTLNWINLKTPLPLGIDFTGGSLLEVQFSGTRPSSDEMMSVYLQFAPDSDPARSITGRRLLFHPVEKDRRQYEGTNC